MSWLAACNKFACILDIDDKDLQRKLEILTHILYNNPRILFAPNNTAAFRIIQKVRTVIIWQKKVKYLDPV